MGARVSRGRAGRVCVEGGGARVGEAGYVLRPASLARLSRVGDLRLSADAGTRLLVITGRPLGEPIVQRGPFVMNTAAEIQQAIRDYSDGSLTL